MKGMLDFLERAGLVKKDAPAESPAPDIEITLAEPTAPPTATPAAAPVTAAPTTALPAAAPASAGTPLKLDDIYARHGVGPSLYPAERLLRLVDGLSAMDPATRLMAIRAMDAADESWTIADPLADAAAKVTALAAHGEAVQRILQQLEIETQTQLNSALARQEQVVGEIRKQMAELEALVERELARTAQETAAYQASLQAARDQSARELCDIAQASQRLQSLAAQFGSTATTPPGP
ncbi:MAG: methyl-accepting chemotaxis protein [Rhodoferax sp.]|jgi:hypothetical protein|nr:methyl-accepting chemotaxis protein [Rhodoferax sp.]